MQQSSVPQYDIRFRIGDDAQWFGQSGRALVGSLFKTDGPELLSKVFHHSPAGGLLPVMPTIRFRGGKGFFGITAIGRSSIDTLQSLEHIIRRRIAEHLGRPITTESADTEVSLSLSERANVYRAHLVVFARKHSAMKTKFEYSDDRLLMYLRGMALRDIRTQADALGLELPGEHFPFQILDVGPRGRVPLNKPGQALYCGYVKHIDFLTTLSLKGSWALGGLQNRGHGSVRPFRCSRAGRRSIAKVSGDTYAHL